MKKSIMQNKLMNRNCLNLVSNYFKRPIRFIRFSDFGGCQSFVAVEQSI